MAAKKGGGDFIFGDIWINCEVLFEPILTLRFMLLAEAGPIISSHGVDSCRTSKLHSTLGIFRSGFL